MLADHAAALLWSTAVLLVAGAGLALTVGARRIAEWAGRSALSAAVAALLLAAVVRLLARAIAVSSADGLRQQLVRDAHLPDDAVVVASAVAVAVGHAVLGVALLMRRMQPNAAAERTEARARDRARERPRVPVRSEEVEP